MNDSITFSVFKGAFYLGITPESLGIDSADKCGRKFRVDVLSAKFKL